MPNIQATGTGGNITISNLRVTTPAVSNTTIISANTEQGIALPANTVKFKLKARGTARLQIAYTATESGTNYMTIYPGQCYEEDAINRVSTTIYIQSSKAGEVVEIVSWS